MDVTPEPDLTPRTTEESRTATTTKRRRSPAVWVALALVVVGIGFVLYQGLNNAALYYRNADEAIRDKAALSGQRFRVQGSVQNNVTTVGHDVEFSIQFPTDQPPSPANTINVRYTAGDPPELFKAGVPVVLEGKWSADGSFFTSDRILVKHTEEYKASNPDRVSSDAP